MMARLARHVIFPSGDFHHAPLNQALEIIVSLTFSLTQENNTTLPSNEDRYHLKMPSNIESTHCPTSFLCLQDEKNQYLKICVN